MDGANMREAVAYLEAFHAEALDRHNVHYHPVPEDAAPSTYDDICQAFQSGNSYPVWEGGSDTSIYSAFGSGECGNWEFRALHDYYHATHGKDLTVDGECELAFIHVDQFRRWAISNAVSPALIAYASRVLLVDTLGQTVVFHLTDGGFVYDQTDFMVCCLSAPGAWQVLGDALEMGLSEGACKLAMLYLADHLMDGGLDHWLRVCNSYPAEV